MAYQGLQGASLADHLEAGVLWQRQTAEAAERLNQIAEEANAIAREANAKADQANEIARAANKQSFYAWCVAIIAVGVAIVGWFV